MPLQFEDQTAALQLGHFATNSVLGSHVTHVLDGTGTEAGPGISSLALFEAVRNAAASCQTRRIARQAACGPTTSAVKQPPVARDEKEWYRFRAPVEITDLLKEEVFDDRSTFAPLSAVLNRTAQTSTSATQFLYPLCAVSPQCPQGAFSGSHAEGQRSRWSLV
jgi:hypothetical protein